MSTTYNETRCNLKITKPEGKVEEKIAFEEEKVQEMIAEAQEKSDGTVVEITGAQTFIFHQVSEASPIEDFVNFVSSVEEQANLINRAIVLKQQQYTRRLMGGKEWTPVEGAYDLGGIVGQVSERATASPEQKAANALGKLLGRNVSTDELANIIASLGTATQPA